MLDKNSSNELDPNPLFLFSSVLFDLCRLGLDVLIRQTLNL